MVAMPLSRKIFVKKFVKTLASSKNSSNFAAQKTKNGPLAQLNRAFDYGSKGYRFESCRDHLKEAQSLRNQSVASLAFVNWNSAVREFGCKISKAESHNTQTPMPS